MRTALPVRDFPCSELPLGLIGGREDLASCGDKLELEDRYFVDKEMTPSEVLGYGGRTCESLYGGSCWEDQQGRPAGWGCKRCLSTKWSSMHDVYTAIAIDGRTHWVEVRARSRRSQRAAAHMMRVAFLHRPSELGVSLYEPSGRCRAQHVGAESPAGMNAAAECGTVCSKACAGPCPLEPASPILSPPPLPCVSPILNNPR